MNFIWAFSQHCRLSPVLFNHFLNLLNLGEIPWKLDSLHFYSISYIKLAGCSIIHQQTTVHSKQSDKEFRCFAVTGLSAYESSLISLLLNGKKSIVCRLLSQFSTGLYLIGSSRTSRLLFICWSCAVLIHFLEPPQKWLKLKWFDWQQSWFVDQIWRTANP